MHQSIDFDTNYVPKIKNSICLFDSILRGCRMVGIYGPYVESNNYVVAKMLGSKTLPDSVRCQAYINCYRLSNDTQKTSPYWKTA